MFAEAISEHNRAGRVGVGHRRLDLFKVPLSCNCFSSKASGCPQFPGYYFIPGKTYDQYDMVKSCSSSSSAELAAECTKTSYCQAFTTAGMMKYRIPPGELGTGTTETGRKLGLNTRVTSQQAVSNFMLEYALPVAYDSTSASDTGGYNFIPPAPDQAACGVCAAFAVAGLAHAAMAAATKQSYTAVPALSAQHMYFCAGKEAAARTCANGTTIDSVLQQLVKSAPLQERCLPWSKPGGLKRPTNVCSKRCSSSAGGSFKWGKLYDIAAAKEAIVRNGAVAAVMLLYPDLTPSTRCRPQQVYARRSAIPADLVLDPHAVLVVGWDDRGESWLVRNSWGSWPGGSRPGFFKVKYGEAGLMAPGFMYELSWTGPGAKARTLGPKFIQRDPTNASCSWYTAQPGDTLAGVWRASGVKRLQQLLAANTNTALIDGSRLAGKRVRICK
ncbi:hypothetical protein OEZ86_013875 [Tetradesmus obliquus]|nr:hypothetical protein OEZ86_013875 [Tetradesmus obliquus]